ncbi:DUF3618 domain-containing protein [Streptacidiphilus sp. PAMC 29251]
MSTGPENENSTPTPEELREMVEGTREELGQTVAELAAKADVKARAKDRTAAIKAEAKDKTAEIKDKTAEIKAEVMESAIDVGTQAREGIAQAAHVAQESVVDPVLEGGAAVAAKGAAVAAKVREKTPEPVAAKARQATDAVRRRPGPAIAAAVSAVVVFFAIRRRARR